MKYYLIGIKGSGMSALASLLYDLGNTVVGYDDSLEKKFTSAGLEKRGIKIYHDDSFQVTSDFIACYSNAISHDHKEIKRLEKLNIKMIKYQDLIGSLSRQFETISVSGTHGKTTTSLMIASILDKVYGANYFVGDGRGHGDIKNKLFVLESCEYNKHFLAYEPTNLIITNIELEHTECYKDLDDIILNFNKLALKTKNNIILCGDDENCRKIKTQKKVYYYGFQSDNDLIAKNLDLNEEGSSFDVYFEGKFYGHFTLKLFGRHMILDSLACILTCILYNVEKEVIQMELNNFKGAIRRFSETKIKETIIIDDYAHHPTEIKATLASIRQKYPQKEVVAVFLPNTYSRTRDFQEEFANVLSQFDYSYIMDIKCDRENPKDYPGVSSDALIKKTKNSQKISVETLDLLTKHLDDVICFMSCANISPIISKFIEKIK